MRSKRPTRDKIERYILMKKRDNVSFESKTACLPNYRRLTDVIDIMI